MRDWNNLPLENGQCIYTLGRPILYFVRDAIFTWLLIQGNNLAPKARTSRSSFHLHQGQDFNSGWRRGKSLVSNIGLFAHDDPSLTSQTSTSLQLLSSDTMFE